MIWSLVFACVNSFGTVNGSKWDDGLDTGNEDSGDDGEEVTLPEDSIENFKLVYCEHYADRCDIYASLEECEADVDSWFAPTCTIVDKSAFDACADWLFSLDCQTEGWIAACDQFYECP